MKLNKIVRVSLFMILYIFVFQISIVNASLQSNGGTAITKKRDDWMVEIRQMEATGGNFGLAETTKSDLTFSNTSNSIDVHMQKNTEYGAMAILSASSYGNPSTISANGTTTGNNTGVVITSNYEWVAAHYGFVDIVDGYGGVQGRSRKEPLSYNGKYYNYYLNESYAFNGDALFETQGWHNSTADIGQSDQPRSRNL